ncbi:nuclease PIN [Escherichia coli]|uniref:pilus-assembly fibrillin subunit n=2 Tax=Escherichia coli TaxID=562 RepID=UPI001BD2D2B0|nr:pilus-assembly fibrillin subunit [Escherichia coli]MBS9328588.1 nuclease PIN [Escherichia coli]
MNRAAAGFYLAVVLGSCSMNGVSQADELLTWDDFFVADESRHQWVNEHNGRTGALNVKGALVSSPCSLKTNEIQLPFSNKNKDLVILHLQGCGTGVVGDRISPINRERIPVKQKIMFYEGEQSLYSKLLLSVSNREIFLDGENQLVYSLSVKQSLNLKNKVYCKTLQSSTICNNVSLRLQLSYE